MFIRFSLLLLTATVSFSMQQSVYAMQSNNTNADQDVVQVTQIVENYFEGVSSKNISKFNESLKKDLIELLCFALKNSFAEKEKEVLIGKIRNSFKYQSFITISVMLASLHRAKDDNMTPMNSNQIRTKSLDFFLKAFDGNVTIKHGQGFSHLVNTLNSQENYANEEIHEKFNKLITKLTNISPNNYQKRKLKELAANTSTSKVHKAFTYQPLFIQPNNNNSNISQQRAINSHSNTNYLRQEIHAKTNAISNTNPLAIEIGKQMRQIFPLTNEVENISFLNDFYTQLIQKRKNGEFFFIALKKCLEKKKNGSVVRENDPSSFLINILFRAIEYRINIEATFNFVADVIRDNNKVNLNALRKDLENRMARKKFPLSIDTDLQNKIQSLLSLLPQGVALDNSNNSIDLSSSCEDLHICED